jgi:hypothetical protein
MNLPSQEVCSQDILQVALGKSHYQENCKSIKKLLFKKFKIFVANIFLQEKLNISNSKVNLSLLSGNVW